jgi:hypothetical protein
MSIAFLCVDPWLIMSDFPPCNFVVSERRSLGKHPSPCTKVTKNPLKKIILLIEYTV